MNKEITINTNDNLKELINIIEQKKDLKNERWILAMFLLIAFNNGTDEDLKNRLMKILIDN